MNSQPLCKTCVHFQLCKFLISATEFWTECDFTPSRYSPAYTEQPLAPDRVSLVDAVDGRIVFKFDYIANAVLSRQVK